MMGLPIIFLQMSEEERGTRDSKDSSLGGCCQTSVRAWMGNQRPVKWGSVSLEIRRRPCVWQKAISTWKDLGAFWRPGQNSKLLFLPWKGYSHLLVARFLARYCYSDFFLNETPMSLISPKIMHVKPSFRVLLMSLDRIWDSHRVWGLLRREWEPQLTSPMQ